MTAHVRNQQEAELWNMERKLHASARRREPRASFVRGMSVNSRRGHAKGCRACELVPKLTSDQRHGNQHDDGTVFAARQTKTNQAPGQGRGEGRIRDVRTSGPAETGRGSAAALSSVISGPVSG